jgi:leader peptidase (prepilin peptidase) / N-methyltransferase
MFFSFLEIGFALVFFMIGTIVGSFLGVVISRLPREGMSMIWPRSHCLSCKRPIVCYDLVPVISWCLLRARCRYCKDYISWRLPFIELLMGGFALAFWLRFGLQLAGLELFIFSAILVVIAFIDIDTWSIPLSLLIFLIISGLFFGGIISWQSDSPDSDVPFDSRILGCVFGFLFFAAFLIISTWVLRRLGRLQTEELAMGWGDPWLLAGIGAYVGILGLPYVILLSCLQGIAVFLIIKPQTTPTKDGWQPPAQAIAFGPFLSLAGLEVALWGHELNKMGQELAIFLGS